MQDSTQRPSLKAINENIAALRKTAGFLESQTTDFPALQRNVQRISASIKMLELNLSDALTLDQEDAPGM
ncbi:MAG: hypothetical protein V2J08_05435 [Desulfotignum sp.]|jgi:hypothetical protein|nr:hypothetical protein [Desulfotignum sp.]